jgi:mono/diheme cytochrome c family protein
VTGRGSWRATLFLVRPGDLTKTDRDGASSSQYLVDLIRNGGAPIGRPGMPAVGGVLGDAEMRDLVEYVQSLRAP